MELKNEREMKIAKMAWDEGFKQGGPMHDEHYGEPDKHTINPYSVSTSETN